MNRVDFKLALDYMVDGYEVKLPDMNKSECLSLIHDTFIKRGKNCQCEFMNITKSMYERDDYIIVPKDNYDGGIDDGMSCAGCNMSDTVCKHCTRSNHEKEE